MPVRQPLCPKAFTFLALFSNPRNPCRKPSLAAFYKGETEATRNLCPRHRGGCQEGLGPTVRPLLQAAASIRLHQAVPSVSAPFLSPDP